MRFMSSRDLDLLLFPPKFTVSYTVIHVSLARGMLSVLCGVCSSRPSYSESSIPPDSQSHPTTSLLRCMYLCYINIFYNGEFLNFDTQSARVCVQQLTEASLVCDGDKS